MESRTSEARGCLLMIGWLYVIGLFVGLVLAGWDVLSSGLRDVLSWESLSGFLLAIVWPLIILALAAGHGAPPMPLWARFIVLPPVLAWIALGWWVISRTGRYWLRRHARKPKETI